MENRKYNLFFHIHTISGIITAVLLFVVFFAGSFSFFRDEIGAWHKGKSFSEVQPSPDYNRLLDSLSHAYDMKGRNLDFFILRKNQGAFVNMSPSQDSIMLKKDTEAKAENGAAQSAYFLYYFKDKKATTYADDYDLGEFLYRLHFLAPLNIIPIHVGYPFGYVLAGSVAFLFLFALITGLFLHWDKIKTNFFLIRPWSKWKTVWTDMHTVLGVIGFPYQFIFAITGGILILNIVFINPFSNILYAGDTSTLNEELHYSHFLKPEYTYKDLHQPFDLNKILENQQKEWSGSRISRIYINNYNDESMQLGIEAVLNPKMQFAGSGFMKMDIASGHIVAQKSPNTDSDYIDYVRALMYHLHFGDFGGKPLKVFYFLLGIMGCFIIISGMLIWQVARDKPTVEKKRRVFNFWAVNVFLSACLSMLPVTAFTFLMVRIYPETNQSLIYATFFYSWLMLGVIFLIQRNYARINRQMLLLSGILCFLVPIFNGLDTGLWIWKSASQKAFDIFAIDFLFLVISMISLHIYLKVIKS